MPSKKPPVRYSTSFDLGERLGPLLRDYKARTNANPSAIMRDLLDAFFRYIEENKEAPNFPVEIKPKKPWTRWRWRAR